MWRATSVAVVVSTASAFSTPGWPAVSLSNRYASIRLDVAGSVDDASQQELAEAGFSAWWDDTDDEVSGRVCDVVGSLPAWLRGRLIRNGPGRWKDTSSRSYTHAFDGLAKLVAFDISEDGVTFTTRFLRTDWYGKVTSGGMPPSVTSGPVTPPWSATEGISAALSRPAFDNAPMSVHRLGGSERWVAVTDTPPLIEFDPMTLETLGRVDTSATPIVGATKKFGLSVPGFEAFSTAHPQRHPRTGETLNYHLEIRPLGGPVAHIIASSARPGRSSIERRVLGSVELDSLVKNSAGDQTLEGIPFVTSFGVSANFIVLMLYPLTIPYEKLANGEGFLKQLEWHADSPSVMVVWDLNKEVPIGPAGVLHLPQSPTWTRYHPPSLTISRRPKQACSRRPSRGSGPPCGHPTPSMSSTTARD